MASRLFTIAVLLGSAVAFHVNGPQAVVAKWPVKAHPMAFFGPFKAKPVELDEEDELSAAEERRLKLEIGTNWPPRTSTVKGEG